MHRYILSIFLSCSVLFTASAQDTKIISTKDGLCSSEIKALHIDSYGSLWIGTSNGLNRLDGNVVRSFYADISDSNHLPNDVVQVIAEDRDRNLLLGTEGGLCSFSLDRQEFRSVALRDGSQPNVSSILVRHSGEVIVSTFGYGGIYRLSKDEEGMISASRITWTDDPNVHEISTIFEDSDAKLWLCACYSGVYTIDADGRVEKIFGLDENHTRLEFSSMCQDHYGTIYMASRNQGLLARKDGETDFSQILPEEVVKQRVTKLIYRQDIIYICTEYGGLYSYNVNDETLIPVKSSIIEEFPQRKQVCDLVFDIHGNTAMAINHVGVSITGNRRSMFNSSWVGKEDGTRRADAVLSMTVSRDGDIWAGTESGGLFLLDSKMNVIRHVEAKNGILSVCEDRTGTVWYGEEGNGLFFITAGSREPHKFKLPAAASGINRNVDNILEDERGQIWVCCKGDGMYVISRDRKNVRSLPLGDDNHDTRLTDDVLENKWVNCMTEVKGKIYFGTYNGLSCYNIRTNSFLSNFPDANHIFDGVIINDIAEDSDHDLWLATTTGLIRLDTKTFQHKTYSYNDGLPQNNICAVEEDHQKKIWISTANGLAFLNRESDSFTRVQVESEFCNKSSTVFGEGNLAFGNRSGITWFSPDAIDKRQEQAEIYISRMTIGNKHFPPEHADGEEMVINHNENTFSLAFTTGSFYDNGRAAFSYRMDNGESEYLARGTNRVTFNKLTSGKHKLTVSCTSPDKKYNDLILNIRVKRPWYSTVKAALLYLAVIAALAILFLLDIQKKAKKKEEEQNEKYELELNKTKLQYFFGLAHEIRMPVSLIISPLSKLMATDQNPEHQVQYGMMANNARRINLLVNQIMDIRKIERGKMKLLFRKTDINQYLLPIAEVMEQAAQNKRIILTFSPAKDNPEVWIDNLQFDKIVLNILHNAVKFTPECGNISMTVNTDDDHLKICISDSGPGIDEDKLDTIFERFYQGEHQNSTMGVGIGLSLVQSLVRMHHGTIMAYNLPDRQGACFEVSIPLGREHLSDDEITSETPAQEYSFNNLMLYETSYVPNSATNEKLSKVRRSVAIVEDNDDVRRYLQKELSSEYNVTAYSNGQEAFDGILKNTPDIVVCDVIMPGLNGFQLCDKIKNNINTNAIPVIILTGKTDEADKMAGMEVGADAFITKPFNIVLLKKNISQLLESVSRLKNIYIGRQQGRIENIPELKTPDERLLDRIDKVLATNIKNQELSVEMLAKEVGISRVHLYRKLTELTNQGPSEYIRNTRLKMAAEMLKEKRLDIASVAAETGFSSVSVFSRTFKQLFGVSPSEYPRKG